MPIIENQIKKLIAKESLHSLQSGRTIDVTYIARLIAEKVRQLNGGPLMQLYLQESNAKFNIEAYNKMMEDIQFDIEILYDSIIEKSEDVMRQFNSSEVSYRSQQKQMSVVMGVLDNLLFTTRNADDYFYGVFDTFNTLDKIDLNKSSSGIVDLAEGCAQLPYSVASARRHQLPHLIKANTGTIKVASFDGKKVRGRNGGNSIYGYAFSDISTIWRYEAITESKNGVELTFTFPCNQDESIARLTRVEISVPTGGGMTARLLYSLDGENFIRPPATTDKIIFAETTKLAWDFQDTGMRYIRLSLTKLVADGLYVRNESAQKLFSPVATAEIAKPIEAILGAPSPPQEFLYSFNVALVACYKIGRSFDGVLVSKPLAFEDKDDTIDYVAIESEEEIPPGTYIQYEVALSDSKGNPTTDFIPINPSNRPDSELVKVVEFGKSTVDLTGFTVGPNTAGVVSNKISANQIDFYPIHSLNSTYEYKFGSCKLARGGNLFNKSLNPSEIIKQVRNCYLDFSDGKRTKPLYTVVTDPCSAITRFVSQLGLGVLARSFIKTPKPIIQNTNPKPGPDDDPETDISPDYSVFKLELIPTNTIVTGQPIAPTQPTVTIDGVQVPSSTAWTGATTSQASYGVPILYSGRPIDVVYQADNKPVLSYISGSFRHIFRDGIDYTIKRSDDSYFDNFNNWQKFPIHWRVIGNIGNQSQMPPYNLGSGSTLVNMPTGATLYLNYNIDTDITHRIVNVSTDEIELDCLRYLDPGDILLATYKTKPSSIDRRSIKIKPNSASTSYLQENVDYTVDIFNGTISKIIGAGLDTSATQICYSDFSYKTPATTTINYSVWCYLDSREPVVFDYAKMNLKRELGESFTWTYTDAGKPVQKEISEAESITLSRGWHFFTVTSLDPALFTDAAITKCLKLRSLDNKYLFLRRDYGGSIFSKITGRKTTMRQVDLSFLKNSTLKSDNSTFAIGDDNKIYTNFLPATTDDFYMYRVSSDGTIVQVVEEEIDFQGFRKLEYASEQNKGYVIVRALLSRNTSTDGGITPKIHSYNLRVSY